MEDIIKHMIDRGFDMVPSIPLRLDNRVHRFATNGTGKDGWYAGSMIFAGGNSYIYVTYGDWSKGVSYSYRSHERNETPSFVIASQNKVLQAQKILKEEEQKKAFLEMKKLWQSADEAFSSHPYLVRKKLSSTQFLKQSKDVLLIPVMDVNNKIISLQRIFPDGTKRFFKGLPTKGGFFYCGDVKPNENVFITESIGNALSLYHSTGNAVFCSFSAQELSSTVQNVRKLHPHNHIILVADNDGKNGIGQTKAYSAANETLNIEVVVPFMENKEKCDISDIYVNKGRGGVLEQLPSMEKGNKTIKNNSPVSTPLPLEQCSIGKMNYPGIINQIIEYYNSTSMQYRPGFAAQTALAFCSVILSRKFKTEYNHHASLYFLNIGRSGSGKEHQITVIQNLLDKVNMRHLLGASGYTSPGAILTALMKAPAHITLIDEFGDYLISLADKKSHQRLVNRCLLQLFGRCNGSYIGEQYSKFTKNNDNEERVIIKNPSLTILAGVQPNKFYSNIHTGLIEDGFLGRFLVYECDEPNQPVHLKKKDEVNNDKIFAKVKEWVDIVSKRFCNPSNFGADQDYSATPDFVTMKLDEDALSRFNEFSDYITHELQPELDSSNSQELVSRWTYMIGSLSLIGSMARNPWGDMIIKDDVEFAISYVKSLGLRFVKTVIEKVNTTQYEKDKNEFLQAIKSYGDKGISNRDIGRKKPFYRFPKRDRTAILDDLLESELITKIMVQEGRKRQVYFCAVRHLGA
jgi:phage/plasmid primase-like uncharacterized protein